MIGEELSLRLGLRSEGFDAGLQRAVVQTKQFGKEFGDLKKLFVAGGVGTAAIAVFRSIIDHAEEAESRLGSTGRSVVEFGNAFGGIKTTVMDFGATSVGVFNQIGNTIGSGIQHALAFGKSLYEIFEMESASLPTIGRMLVANNNELAKANKAVETTGAALLEVEKNYKEAFKHADDFKKITAELAKLEKDRADALFKALTPQERLNQLNNELTDLYQKQSAENLTALQRRELQRDVAVAENKLLLEQIDQEKTRRDEATKTAKATHEAQMANLTTTQRIAALKDDIVIAETLAATQSLSQRDRAAATVTLAERKVELLKAENEQTKEIAQNEQKSRLSNEDELRIFTLQQKAKTGLTEAEREELKLLLLQKQELANQLEINKLLEKGIQNLTPEEKKRLEELMKQDKKLEDQITKKQELTKEASGPQLEAEKQITKEMEEQKKVADAAAKAAKEAAEIKLRQQTKGVVYTGGDLRDLSDVQLETLRLKAEGNYTSLHLERLQKGRNWESVEEAVYRQSMTRAKEEQALRANFQNTVTNRGLLAAEKEFSPEDFRRLTSLYGDLQQKNNLLLADIQDRLAGILPRR